MKKLKDERLFRMIREFLTIHLPKQRMLSAHTVKSYRESINLFLAFLQEKKHITLSDVTFEMLDAKTVQAFLDWLREERHCSRATMGQRLSCIRSFVGYAAKMDAAFVDQQKELRKIDLKKTHTPAAVTFFSEDALKAILKEPDATTKKGIRDMFYMILLYDSGARNGELLSLRLRDVDLSPGRARIQVSGKGNKTRLIPIMDKTAEHCRKYLSLFHPHTPDPNAFLFYTVRQGDRQQMSDDNVARFMKKYGFAARQKCGEVPENVHPHLFRHTRAMHLYRKGMPLVLVAQWLGHAHLETTLVYANADTEMKRTAINKATDESNPLQDELFSDARWRDDAELIRAFYGLR